MPAPKTASPNNKPQKRNAKAQSAIEYLTTYGWAILVLTIVGALLFGLVVLKSSSSTSVAQPGGCQVYRPNGPGTTISINLEGACNSMKPQYVAGFNGGSSYITGNALASPITATAWIYVTSYPSSSAILSTIMEFDGSSSGAGNIQFQMTSSSWSSGCTGINGGLLLWGQIGNDWCSTSTIPLKTWTFVAFTSNSVGSTVYINGASQGSSGGLASQASSNTIFVVGYQNCCGGRYFNGFISNVQLYNTALSASEIQALYAEGIGGDPIVIQNLAGWWPLNGDFNDYSGNGNNGVSTAVIMNGTWVSAYTGP
jgi:hypothetical protein